MRLGQERSGNLPWGHSVFSCPECSPSAPLVGGGSHGEPGKEFQGFFRISTEKGCAYIVPDMPKERRGYIKERKKNVYSGSQPWLLRRGRESM